jgi:hypothetical protein
MEDQNIPVAKPVEPVQTTGGQPTQAGSTRAVVTLILGILSLVCAGFLTGIPAIILGNMELKAIKKGEAPKEGEGVAKVGFILGIVGTVLTCLAMIGFFLIMILGITLGTSGALNEAIQKTAIAI